ncbi:MAG: hypothetical protein U1E31_03050 [Rickettsiales bacterium]
MHYIREYTLRRLVLSRYDRRKYAKIKLDDINVEDFTAYLKSDQSAVSYFKKTSYRKFKFKTFYNTYFDKVRTFFSYEFDLTHEYFKIYIKLHDFLTAKLHTIISVDYTKDVAKTELKQTVTRVFLEEKVEFIFKEFDTFNE